MKLKQIAPILSWLPSYKKEWLAGDISAGITVGIMLIPQGMAYAMLAGLPPIYGLYAAVVPLLVYAVFGTSRQLAVGPVAMDSLLVLSGVSAIASVGTEYFVEIAILLALAEGLVLLLLGVLKMGFLVNFLSSPVISGFTSAAALIIGFNQLKYILGVSIPSSNYLHEILINAVKLIPNWNWLAVIIGLAGIAIIKALKKFLPKVPAALVVVALSILLVFVFKFNVNIVGNIPTGLPAFKIPVLNWDIIQKLAPTIFTLALVAFLEAISVAKAVHANHRDYKIDANQELIAIGLANVIGSFFQSFSVTGGFSRTAVNDQSGANTPLASIISAVLIAVTLLFLTPLFYFLPKAILASIIMVAVFGLFDYKEPLRLFKTEKLDLLMLVGTFVATLTLGIANGIGVGVALSLVIVVFKTAYPHMAQLGLIEGTRYYRNIERFEEAKTFKELLIIRFDAQLYFANASYFKDKTMLWASNKEGIKAILFDFQTINNIDSSAIKILEEMLQHYQEYHIELLFAGVKGPVRDKMTRSNFINKAKEDSFYMNVAEAKEAFYKEKAPDSREYTHQANTY